MSVQHGKYHVVAATDEIRNLLYKSLTYEDTKTKAAYVVHAIITACDIDHRAIFYMAPSIVSVMEAALSSLKVQIEEETAANTDNTYRAIQDLIEYASERLTLAADTIEDVGATFTAYKDGKSYVAEISPSGQIATSVVAGLAVPDEEVVEFNTIHAWAVAYDLPREEIVADYMVCAEEEDDTDSVG